MKFKQLYNILVEKDEHEEDKSPPKNKKDHKKTKDETVQVDGKEDRVFSKHVKLIDKGVDISVKLKDNQYSIEIESTHDPSLVGSFPYETEEDAKKMFTNLNSISDVINYMWEKSKDPEMSASSGWAEILSNELIAIKRKDDDTEDHQTITDLKLNFKF